MTLQEQFDEAMFEFSTGNSEATITRLQAILALGPEYFDAQLALGGAYYAKGDYAAAIARRPPGRKRCGRMISWFIRIYRGLT